MSPRGMSPLLRRGRGRVQKGSLIRLRQLRVRMFLLVIGQRRRSRRHAQEPIEHRCLRLVFRRPRGQVNSVRASVNPRYIPRVPFLCLSFHTLLSTSSKYSKLPRTRNPRLKPCLHPLQCSRAIRVQYKIPSRSCLCRHLNETGIGGTRRQRQQMTCTRTGTL
jgi:hypothetical protein